MWIASYPKSGNTWFRLFLSSLLNPEKESIDINNIDAVSLLASSRVLFDSISGINSSDLRVDEINAIRPEVYRIISSENNNTIYIKVHDAWQRNDSGDELFPSNITKGVVLLVRNPFDLTVSLSNHNGISLIEAANRLNDSNFSLSINPSKLNNQLQQLIGSWSEHFRSWVDRSNLNVFVMRYEDMLLKPYQTFSRALNFLDIKVDRSIIESSIRKCSFEILQQKEEESGFKEKPIISKRFFKMGKCYYYKKLLNEEITRILTINHMEILKRLEYNCNSFH